MERCIVCCRSRGGRRGLTRSHEGTKGTGATGSHEDTKTRRHEGDGGRRTGDGLTRRHEGTKGWYHRETGSFSDAKRHLRGAFPGLPSRTQTNRAIRSHHDAIVAVGQALVRQRGSQYQLDEVLDGMWG
jgi:hypothetical protein